MLVWFILPLPPRAAMLVLSAHAGRRRDAPL